jgi:hypothetical protein
MLKIDRIVLLTSSNCPIDNETHKRQRLGVLEFDTALSLAIFNAIAVSGHAFHEIGVCCKAGDDPDGDQEAMDIPSERDIFERFLCVVFW